MGESEKGIMSNHNILKNLPESERPYEKMISQGAEVLSDSELLAIILRSGTKKYTSIELARNLLEKGQKNLLNLYDFSLEELINFDGIGKVKAIQLKAVAELSQRISRTTKVNKITLNNPKSIADFYMEQMRHLKHEILLCSYFDAKCNFLGDTTISQGSSNCASFSCRDIFKAAFDKSASQIILLHNHPSGDPKPSKSDIHVTRRVRENAEILSFCLADHIIIGDNQYFSFRENKYI